MINFARNNCPRAKSRVSKLRLESSEQFEDDDVDLGHTFTRKNRRPVERQRQRDAQQTSALSLSLSLELLASLATVYLVTHVAFKAFADARLRENDAARNFKL